MIAGSIDLPMDAIIALCREYGMSELSIFGSALRDDFDPEKSDVDLLVVFHDDDYGPWMGKLTDLEDELSKALGKKVDLVPKGAVEASENYILRKIILNSPQVIYET